MLTGKRVIFAIRKEVNNAISSQSWEMVSAAVLLVNPVRSQQFTKNLIDILLGEEFS